MTRNTNNTAVSFNVPQIIRVEKTPKNPNTSYSTSTHKFLANTNNDKRFSLITTSSYTNPLLQTPLEEIKEKIGNKTQPKKPKEETKFRKEGQKSKKEFDTQQSDNDEEFFNVKRSNKDSSSKKTDQRRNDESMAKPVVLKR